MPEPIRSLPPQPSLEQQRKLAKELLSAFRSGDAEAIARVRRQLPDKTSITLAGAQFVLAREYGFDSWAKLKAHIEPAVAVPLDPALHGQFQRAFEARDAAAVRELFEANPQAQALINAPIFSFGGRALNQFSGPDDAEMAGVLLEYGADPNLKSDWAMGPWHPLHAASPEVADRLIEAGAVVDACAASHLDRIDELRRILDEDPSRVHERGGDGQMPLHFARSREVVDLLLERGADLDARDTDHNSTAAQWMLHKHPGQGRNDLARYLVERGASADIFLAAALGLTDRLREILEADPGALAFRLGQGDYGERPPASYPIYFWTIGANHSPMQAAAAFEQREALAVMRDFATPKQGFLAACLSGDESEAKRLLRERPSLMSELTAEDQRALPDAGWAPNAAAVALMLELGFDAAATAHNAPGTVLHCAAWEGCAECVEAALKYDSVRALMEVRDAEFASTPLGWCFHGASNCGRGGADHAGVARLLLAAGARRQEGMEDAPEHMRAVLREFDPEG